MAALFRKYPHAKYIFTLSESWAGTFAQAFTGPMFAPQEGGAVITGPVVDPLYIQASLVAHAWPVQALLESLRRQYGGA